MGTGVKLPTCRPLSHSTSRNLRFLGRGIKKVKSQLYKNIENLNGHNTSLKEELKREHCPCFHRKQGWLIA